MESICSLAPPSDQATHNRSAISNTPLPEAVAVAPSAAATPKSSGEFYSTSHISQRSSLEGAAYSLPLPPPYPPQITQQHETAQRVVEEEYEEEDAPLLSPSVVSTDGRSEDTFNLFENMAVHGEGEERHALNPVHDPNRTG